MKKAISIIIILAIVIIGGGVGLGYYFTESASHIKTDDATVVGDIKDVVAMQSGQVTKWNVKAGDLVKKDQVIGTISTVINGKPVSQDIKAISDGTVLKTNTSQDEPVQAGSVVAVTSNLQNLYITANIDETSLDSVKINQDVDITVDAFPGTTFAGKVTRIGDATLDTFSILPTSSASGNYTKETKRIPVDISITSQEGKHFVPGLNASVSIKK